LSAAQHRFPCQEPLCGLGVAQNRRQRLIELVHQRSRALVRPRPLLGKQAHASPAAPPLRNQRGDQYQLNDRGSGWQ
jgi:hypothetical protein